MELVVCFVWVYGSTTPPFPEVMYHQASNEASLVCNLSGSYIGFSLWLIYNAGLVVVCTFQAFLVRKVPQNYNESKLIAFNMTTICITVFVYIPSYMGTTGWYRTVISSFMCFFLGTLTWASIFAPKIYIILFRPHKNVPMRPSVSSITLGVIMPSPTVGSHLSDQGMRSQSNSSLREATDACEFAYENIEAWDNLGGRFSDASRDMHVIETDRKESRKTSIVRFQDEVIDCLKKRKPMEASVDNTPRPNSSAHPDLLSQPWENEEKINEVLTSKKKTSTVYFDDETSINNVVNQTEPPNARKQSDGSQGGILRKRESCVGEGRGDVSDPAAPNTVMGPRKKKTSLVRFEEEEISNASHGKYSDGASNSSHEIAGVMDGTPEKQISRQERSHEGTTSTTTDTEKESELYLANIGQNVGVDVGRKRKISVFSFSA